MALSSGTFFVGSGPPVQVCPSAFREPPGGLYFSVLLTFHFRSSFLFPLPQSSCQLSSARFSFSSPLFRCTNPAALRRRSTPQGELASPLLSLLLVRSVSYRTWVSPPPPLTRPRSLEVPLLFLFSCGLDFTPAFHLSPQMFP